MSAEEHCHQIFTTKYESFCKDKSWEGIKGEVRRREFVRIQGEVRRHEVVRRFGSTVNSIIDNYLAQYDAETQDCDETVKGAKRTQLTEAMLQDIEPIYLLMLETIREDIKSNFEKAIRDGLRHSIRKKKRLERIAEPEKQNWSNKIKEMYEEAAVRKADWNHADTQCGELLKEMNAFVGSMGEKIEEHSKGISDKICSICGIIGPAATCVLACDQGGDD